MTMTRLLPVLPPTCSTSIDPIKTAADLITCVTEFRDYWHNGDGLEMMVGESVIFNSAIDALASEGNLLVNKNGVDALDARDFAVIWDSDDDSPALHKLQMDWVALPPHEMVSKLETLREIHACLKNLAGAIQRLQVTSMNC